MTIENIIVDPEKIRLLIEPPELVAPKEEEKVPEKKPAVQKKGGK